MASNTRSKTIVSKEIITKMPVKNYNPVIQVENGWIYIERPNIETGTKIYSQFKIECINHINREGPHKDEKKKWKVTIHTIRNSSKQKTTHTVNYWFDNETEAKLFHIGINEKMY